MHPSWGKRTTGEARAAGSMLDPRSPSPTPPSLLFTLLLLSSLTLNILFAAAPTLLHPAPIKALNAPPGGGPDAAQLRAWSEAPAPPAPPPSPPPPPPLPAPPPMRCPEPRFAGVAQACSPSHAAGSCSAAAAAGSRWAELMLEVQQGTAAMPHADPARLDRAYPHAFALFDTLPLQWPAPQLSRFGGGPEADGSKVLRAPLQRPGEEEPCLVYSFGGNAQVDFEVDLLRREPACRVWQFDCTVANATMTRVVAALPADIAQRFTFQPWCVGKDGATMVTKGKGMGRLPGGTDGPHKVALASVATIMGRLGHGGMRLTVLKMDTEGAEHMAIPDMLGVTRPGKKGSAKQRPRLLLPRQVSLELHVARLLRKKQKNRANSTLQPSDCEPVRRLLEAGYVLLWREDNPNGRCCTEVTLQLGCASNEG